MREKAFLLTYAVIMAALLGCAREWKNPNTALPAKEVDVVSILTAPNVYDSAGVIVEGKVWDLAFQTLSENDMEIPYTSFKLADPDGNFVSVFVLGHSPIVEGDIVKVTGIYRREYKAEGRNFANEIEAKRVESKTR